MDKSESIQNIAKALAAFQAEVKNPANTADNPFFKSKYAPLNEILNDVRPLLTKNGLSVLQFPSGEGDSVIITSLLMHESGEWIESPPLVLKMEKTTAQGAGSAITYGRRYQLSAILGISSEDDDDGNSASGKSKQKADKSSHNPPQVNQLNTQQSQTPQGVNATASEAQRKKIYAMTKKMRLSDDDIKYIMQVRYAAKSSKDLSSRQASDMIEYLTKMESGEITFEPQAKKGRFGGGLGEY